MSFQWTKFNGLTYCLVIKIVLFNVNIFCTQVNGFMHFYVTLTI